jgi:hypothetical protein
LKQERFQIPVHEPWTSFSDTLVQQKGLQRGTLFRIFQIDGEIQRLGDDDFAYSFDWKEGRQYWFEIVHDLSRDRFNLTRQVRMADANGHVETFVIPGRSQIEDVRNLWSKIIDCPPNVELKMWSVDMEDFHWGIGELSSAPLIACVLRSASTHANARIYNGSDTFRADQLSRLLDVKTPPFG